jgi:hypothetical protein
VREIHYNGGMVVFSVPDSWHEKTYRGGGAAYFEGSGENGSLYVTLTTAQQESPVNESSFREVANQGRKAGDQEAELLPTGNYLRRFERQEGDEGASQHTVFWMVCNLVPPRTVRIAAFNYGIPVSLMEPEVHKETLAMLDKHVRLARFTTLTPEEIVAAQRASRPWWRFW